MNPEIGWERAQQKRPEPGELPPPTPKGYSLEVLLMLKLIDYVKELIRVMPAVFSGKLPPPIKPEPRPMTAEDLFRDLQETQNVHEAVDNILGRKT
ncbi:hypothetical protein [Nocardia niwae]|uniref:hypothetical protein n=1 Tax=Nocardia niwae TaxID=626084 RepID=UPI0012F4871A|nr:hypothetical protein [Nocardia niwae]